MSFYGSGVSHSQKSDGSVVTEIDQRAHNAIVAQLQPLGLPVVSEEGNREPPARGAYWVVDPLDGTSEYLSMTGDFTVNIALIEERVPTLGVMHAPAQAETWSSVDSRGQTAGLRVIPPKVALISPSEDPDLVRPLALRLGAVDLVMKGAAGKFIDVAEGRALLYVRTVGSSEWDTAAGQAILESRGGCVLSAATGKPLTYGKASLRNEEGFIALGPSMASRSMQYSPADGKWFAT